MIGNNYYGGPILSPPLLHLSEIYLAQYEVRCFILEGNTLTNHTSNHIIYSSISAWSCNLQVYLLFFRASAQYKKYMVITSSLISTPLYGKPDSEVFMLCFYLRLFVLENIVHNFIWWYDFLLSFPVIIETLVSFLVEKVVLLHNSK